MSIFRRVGVAPDGSAVLVPCGQLVKENGIQNCVLVFELGGKTTPVAAFPTTEVTSLVQFCPTFFQKMPEDGSSWTTLFQFIFCVATKTDLLVYSSAQTAPLFLLAGLHYASITDVQWMNDWTTAVVASRDGYLSFIQLTDSKGLTPVPDAR